MKNRSLPVCSIIAGWWARNKDSKPRLDRPFKLLVIVGTVIATSVIVERLFMADDLKWLRDWVRGSAIFGDLLFPDAGTVEWKDRLQGVLVLLGLPVAFCLWHWRDKNVRDQIDNSRKDINLKEFQDVQLRAAGALDTNLPEAAREQLQIAALHQLRGFLRGEYGQSFRRPAFELLLALHQSMGKRLKAPQFRMEASKAPPDGDWRKKGEEIRARGRNLRERQSSLERSTDEVIWSEWHAIWRSGFPFRNRALDLISVPPEAYLWPINFEGAQFAGAYLRGVRFGQLNLLDAHFEGADLMYAHL